MRKLYQRLALVLSMSAVLTMLIFTVSLYGRSRAENIHYLRQLLDGVEENLSHNSEDYRERLELLEEDYLKRARAAEYILSSGPGLVSEEELQIIKELMEVRAVTVIGNSGEILMSTEDETGDGSEESVFYVTVKAQSDRFAAVRVDADPGRLGLMDWEDLMRSTLRQATTEHRTGILAVDPETGEIIGFTRNNAQDFELAGIDTASEFLELLESMADRRAAVLRVNEVYQRVLVRETEGYYLVAFSALDTVFADMTWSFWEGLIGIGAVSTAAILLVRYYLKKYLFRHFETVKEDISRVLAGAAGSGAADAGIPEVQAFVAAISELEKGYLDQAEGMHRMEDELSRARTEAERDKLTGLYNRRGMEKRVEIFLKQETPAGTFVLFDLDNFKRVNDSVAICCRAVWTARAFSAVLAHCGL